VPGNSVTVQRSSVQGTRKVAIVYLVRHAHAGSQKRWSGSDHDRPLSVRGQEQAEGLVQALRDYPVARILTSPTARCRDTVVPLGHDRGVPVEPVGSLDVHAPVERLLELVVDPALGAAVLCGHGEQFRSLLRLLVGSVRFDGPLRLEKGSTWILDLAAGPNGSARYLPPLRVEHPAEDHRLRSAAAG
jgi:phosphohistidine phosphatase SixA